MIKRLIELLIAAAVVYAGWHVGVAYLHYYEFDDALHELALFSARTTEAQVRERVLTLAQQYDIPLDPGAIVIRTDADATEILAPYTQEVKLLPTYTYLWKFEADGHAVHLR